MSRIDQNPPVPPPQGVQGPGSLGDGDYSQNCTNFDYLLWICDNLGYGTDKDGTNYLDSNGLWRGAPIGSQSYDNPDPSKYTYPETYSNTPKGRFLSDLYMLIRDYFCHLHDTAGGPALGYPHEMGDYVNAFDTNDPSITECTETFINNNFSTSVLSNIFSDFFAGKSAYAPFASFNPPMTFYEYYNMPFAPNNTFESQVPVNPPPGSLCTWALDSGAMEAYTTDILYNPPDDDCWAYDRTEAKNYPPFLTAMQPPSPTPLDELSWQLYASLFTFVNVQFPDDVTLAQTISDVAIKYSTQTLASSLQAIYAALMASTPLDNLSVNCDWALRNKFSAFATNNLVPSPLPSDLSANGAKLLPVLINEIRFVYPWDLLTALQQDLFTSSFYFKYLLTPQDLRYLQAWFSFITVPPPNQLETAYLNCWEWVGSNTPTPLHQAVLNELLALQTDSTDAQFLSDIQAWAVQQCQIASFQGEVEALHYADLQAFTTITNTPTYCPDYWYKQLYDWMTANPKDPNYQVVSRAAASLYTWISDRQTDSKCTTADLYDYIQQQAKVGPPYPSPWYTLLNTPALQGQDLWPTSRPWPAPSLTKRKPNS